MHAFAAAGAGFLIAVLWFDLMFDTQTRGHTHGNVPEEKLASIAAYYRRVTTEAQPMSRLVALVMLLTLTALGVEIARREAPLWLAVTSLVLTVGAVSFPVLRTLRNAVALGSREGSIERQSELARKIFRDHLTCLFAMTVVLALQLAA
ncbi:MAG TPA: hypothetical protein VKB71_06410 [Rhizomicrobium sp.]|nr:hypothetical protein [Rhizomicrobium sp.]